MFSQMKNSSILQTKLLLAATSPFFMILCVWGNPLQTVPSSRVKDEQTKPNHFGNVKNFLNIFNCSHKEYPVKDVILFETNDIFLKPDNITLSPTEYLKIGDRILFCPPYQHINSEEVIQNCTNKFVYESHEFQILPNKSALVEGIIIAPNEYELEGKELQICAPEYDDYSDIANVTNTRTQLEEISIYVGQIGSAISIIALLLHLIIFCSVPTLRNPPGYNLASLSFAFLLGYCFSLIGQIPSVLGIFCIISGILQQVFFMAAFFCMNVLAFDVWRTLKNATEKLAVGSQIARKRQFVWYTLYAWGVPLTITSISVIADNSDTFPDSVKPHYGENDVCWMTNTKAKTIFFAAPAFMLFLVNGIFFIWSAWLILSNRMKCTNDQRKQSVKFNFFLYIRLGVMMGLTWLIGVLALILKNDIVWFVFDVLNSLQGLFLFLFFTCTRKVLKLLQEKTRYKMGITEKQTTLSSNSSNLTVRH